MNAVARFRELHSAGCFVMPNPWDAGSARLLEGLGFPALATTSAGCAWSRGCRDNHVPLEAVLAHLEAIASAGRPLGIDSALTNPDHGRPVHCSARVSWHGPQRLCLWNRML